MRTFEDFLQLLNQPFLLTHSFTMQAEPSGLKQLVLKRHIALRLQPNTSAEDIRERAALLRKRIHNGRSGRRQRGLKHVAQNTQHRMEALERGLRLLVQLPLHTRHHLRHKDQINDQRRREQRVLTHIEQTNSLVSAHENLSIILVERALVVANRRHVFNNDRVVGVFASLIQDRISLDHIIDNVALRDFFRSELFLRAKVLAVVVAEVVVTRDGGQLYTRVDQEVHESGLHLRLSGLEVVAPDEGRVRLG